MRMSKNSTLIYFVNNFQVDIESIVFETTQKNDESFLTEMENAPLPSDATIESILNFARSYEVLETEETGFVEMNLN
jgi:hypothetical protein